MVSHKENNEARLAGNIDSILDESYEKNLMAGLLYFDGKDWVSNPTGRHRQPE